MKKIIGVIALLGIVVASCSKGDDVWAEYEEWRALNNDWLKEKQAAKNEDGTPYYKMLVPEWNSTAFVLIHYFNDRSETEGNLSPISTSTTDTRYELSLCDDTKVDSSTTITQFGPGIYRSIVKSNIPGWGVALSDMRCGDTAEVVIPYYMGYGKEGTGPIKPYSNLRFNVRLVDIPFYETKPKK